MSKDKKILVQYADGSWHETDKKAFMQGAKGLQKSSKNISKYGMPGAIDPTYRKIAKTSNFARSFAIISVTIILLLLIVCFIIQAIN